MSSNDKFLRIVQRALQFYDYSSRISDTCPLFPDHVHIEPTNSCNLRCVHCHQSTRKTHFTKKQGMMSLELFQKVIADIKGAASRITLNLQGEPLLNRRAVDMVEHAKQEGLAVSLLTNATNLTPEIRRRLIAAKLDRVVFSFEGSTKELHERIRRRSRYERTLGNILGYIRENFEAGRPSYVCMSMVETSFSKDDISRYREFFTQFPINTIFVNPHLSMGGSTLTSTEVDMSKYDGIPKERIPICRLPWETIAVNWDGTVSPCAVDYNEDHIVGDVNSEPLQEIWNGERMRRFRQCHIDKDYDWIEAQGPLCVPCNCRFNDEYDLRNIKDFIAHYIVRQAKVFAPQLMDAGEQETPAEAEAKYQRLLKEIRSLEQHAPA